MISVLRDAVVEVEKLNWLSLETRRVIQTDVCKNDPTTLLSISAKAFERVEDRWVKQWPERPEPGDLVRWSADYIVGDIDRHTMRVEMGRVATLADDLVGATEWDARVAWVAVAVARVAVRGTMVADYGETDAGLDMEDLDAPALAACIEGNAPVWEPNSEHAAFWMWWLKGPVAAAVAKR